MPAGRPKKTVKDTLPDGWKGEVLALGEVGGSLEEIKGMLDISDDLHYRWMEEEPEYSGTIKRAQRKAQLWWQTQGRVNLKDKDFSATLWYMNMKNRFGWRDKQEVDHTTGGEPLGVIVLPSKKEE